MYDEEYARNTSREQRFNWTEDSVPYYNAVILSTARHGWKNRDYKSVIAKGENAYSPYTFSTRKASAEHCDVKYMRFGRPWVLRGNYYVDLRGYLDLGHDPFLARARANSRMIKSWYAAKRGQHSIGVFLGEMRDTVRLIKSPIKAIAKGLYQWNTDTVSLRVAVRRLRRKARRYGYTSDGYRVEAMYGSEGLIRALTDAYLSFRYGVDPLVRDLGDAMSEFKSSFEEKYPSLERWSGVHTSGYAGEGISNRSGYSYRFHRNARSKAVHVITGKVLITPHRSHGVRDAVEKLTGIRSTWEDVKREFVPTIWQLLPLSFLVDTFTNISEVLEGQYFVASDCQIYGQTTVDDRHIIETRSGISSGSRVFVGGQWGASEYYRVDLNRSVGGSVHLPTLAFNVPDLFGQLGADVTALLASSKKGRLPFEGL